MFSFSTALAVILSWTLGASNILKVVILSTTSGTASETDEHCCNVILPVITHRRSVVKRGGCFQWRLFVCQCLLSQHMVVWGDT